MSDLISRQEAIKKIAGLSMQVYEGDTCVGIRTYLTREEIIYAIDDIPSVESERKKGKWIDGMPYVNSHWKVCSECHVSAPDSCGGFNFCPNCGAEMRGEHE